MNIKLKGLIIHNLLLTKVGNEAEIIPLANSLKKHIIKQDFYPTGPTIYTYEKNEGYRVGVTVNTGVILEEENV